MQDDHQNVTIFSFQRTKNYKFKKKGRAALYIVENWHVIVVTCFSDTMIGSFRTIQMTLSCRGGVVRDPR